MCQADSQRVSKEKNTRDKYFGANKKLHSLGATDAHGNCFKTKQRQLETTLTDSAIVFSLLSFDALRV